MVGGAGVCLVFSTFVSPMDPIRKMRTAGRIDFSHQDEAHLLPNTECHQQKHAVCTFLQKTTPSTNIPDQERFWVVEGRIQQKVKFDAGFGFTTKGPCREWELDWSLNGNLSAQEIMDYLKRESIPFTVRVSVADENMRD